MDAYARLKISDSSSLLKLTDEDSFHLCQYRSLSPQLQVFCHWFFSTWLSTAAQTCLDPWIQILELDCAISLHERISPIAPGQDYPCSSREWSAKQAAGPAPFILQFKDGSCSEIKCSEQPWRIIYETVPWCCIAQWKASALAIAGFTFCQKE